MNGRRGAWLLLILLAVGTLTAAWAQTSPAEPEEPKPSAALEKLAPPDFLSSGPDLKRLPELIVALDRIREQVRAAGNPVDLAHLERMRGGVLQFAGQVDLAVEAWEAAAAAWEQAGDGPGQIQALGVAGALLWESRPEEGRRLVARAVELVRAEKRRPRAAVGALQEAGQISSLRGKLAEKFLASEHPKPLDFTPGTFPPGFFAPARMLFQAALELRERQDPQSTAVAKLLDDLGMAAFLDGDIAVGRGFYERRLALAEKLDEGPSAIAGQLGFLASLAQIQGDFPAARRFLERALVLWKRLQYRRLEAAAALEGLGNVALVEGDAAAARTSYQEALEIRQGEKAEAGIMAASWNSLARLAQDQGDLAAAFQYARQALDLLDGAPTPRDERAQLLISVDRSRILGNLGLLASMRGEATRGREYFDEALSIQRKLNAQADVALILANMAALEINQGRLPQARERLTEAAGIYRRTLPGSTAEVLCLINLGIVASKQNQVEEAGSLLARAREIQEKRAPDSPGMALVLHWLAVIAHQRKDLGAAAELEQRAVAVERRTMGAARADPKPDEDLRHSLPTSRPLGALLSAALASYEVELGHNKEAFLAMETGRAGALRRLLGERQALRDRAGGELWNRLQQTAAALNTAEERLARSATAEEVARDLVTGKTGPTRAAAEALAAARARETMQARAEYVRLVQERNALQTLIEKRAPRAFIPPLTAAQARRSLPAGTVCACFAAGETDTLLFLLKAPEPKARGTADAGDGLSVFRIRAAPEQLRSEIDALRAALVAPATGLAAATRAGRVLFDRLFPGEARERVLVAKRLLISPDGPLWDVSFAALVTEAGPPTRYLGEKPITYTPSLALFRQSREARPAGSGRLQSLVVGNPLLSLPGSAPSADQGERFFLLHAGPPSQLPHSGAEAREVARLYGGEFLTGAGATERAVRHRIGAADVVHLATHSYLLPARPMSSGVLLAAPDVEREAGSVSPKAEGAHTGGRMAGRMKDEGDPIPNAEARTPSAQRPTLNAQRLTDNDGVLQAWEIFTGPRLRAELVVLSACETARGPAAPGEGLVGLTQALQYAGARSIVASQWKVADASTEALMVGFQQKLRAGLPKDEALGQAMAALRKDPRTAHPYYWAPFILMGDPDNPRLGAGHQGILPRQRGSASNARRTPLTRKK